MRGLFEATALLSSSFALAFVVPDPKTVNPDPASAIVEYSRPGPQTNDVATNDGPRVSFQSPRRLAINPFDTEWEPFAIPFRVEGTSRACGESQIQLNGSHLESRWDGARAHGADYSDHFAGRGVSWTISCLYGSTLADASVIHEEDVIHLLSLRFGHIGDRSAPGFAISYQQLGRPSVLRFAPKYVDTEDTHFNIESWRDQSIIVYGDKKDAIKSDFNGPSYTRSSSEQKSLKASWQALKSSVKEQLHNWLPKCGSKSQVSKVVAVPSFTSIPKASPDVTSERPVETDHVSPNAVTFSDAVHTVDHHPTVPTRSLTNADGLIPPASPSSSAPLSSPSSQPDLRLVQIIVPCIVVFSLLGRLYFRCNDPRRRANRAAMKEMRQNKRLYKCAARKQKMKNWIRSFRIKYSLGGDDSCGDQEKQDPTTIHASNPECSVKDDIRALRNAHRMISDMTASEEGWNGYLYDSEGSDRRRSFSTLPGYESDGDQRLCCDIEGNIVINGIHYRRTVDGFTPDSSVISTSPRISRDGTNSDLENEKIESINLGESRPFAYGY